MSLHLQPELAKAAEIVNDLFVANFGRQLRIEIGGGSILAARYRHRLSTDLDLWRKSTPVTTADKGYRNTLPLEIQEKMAHEAWAGGKPDVSLLHNLYGKLKAELADEKMPAEVECIEVSFTENVQFPALEGRKEANVVGTIFRPQRDAEILWGKLRRMKDRAVTLRDLYDFAVMSHLAPEAVETALDEHGEEGRREIARRISARSVDTEKPLLRTTWETEEPERMKEALGRILKGGETFADEKHPRRAGTRWPLDILRAVCRRKGPSRSRGSRREIEQ